MSINHLKTTLPKGIRGRLLLAGALLLFLALLPVLADAALHYGRIHTGAQISGMDVGRMSRDEATATLSAAVNRTKSNNIELAAEERSWTFMPDDLGTRIDVNGSVERAFELGREDGFFSDIGARFSLYFTPRDVPLHGTVETERLDALIEEIGTELDEPAQNASLQIELGELSVIEGKQGRVVDRESLRARIKDTLFSLHATTIHIPMMVNRPHIEGADTSQAAEQAETMLSAPVRLVFEGEEWQLAPDEMQRYVDFQVEGEGSSSRLVPYISAEKAAPFLQQVAETVDRTPKNATWKTDGETATVVSHVSGLVLDPEATAEALTTAALSASDRVAEAQGREQLPDRTTEDAKEMGISAKLASYRTEFGGSSSRRHNVQLAADLINNTLIAPGQEFDFNTVVGPRTAENGFETAPVIINGKLEDSLGGGICQVSTTLFNSAFFAGLEITARRNHSLYISHYPKGRDATVSWGGPDFRFRNDTDDYILIRSASTPSSVLFVIYGDPEGRKVEYTTSNWYGVRPPTEKRVANDDLPEGQTREIEGGQTGRQITVNRTVTRNGQVLHDDKFVSNYPMRPRIVEAGTKTTTTTAPTTTTTVPTTSTTAPPATTTTASGS